MTPADRRRLALWWTLVFALNLPVALLFAWSLVRSPLAWAGVAAGLAPAWGVGMAAVWAGPQSRAVAFVGSWAVAVSQFFAVAQMTTGLLAFALCNRLGIGPDPRDAQALGVTDPLRAFALTALTSIPLLALAALVGLFLRWLNGGWPAEPEPAEDDA